MRILITGAAGNLGSFLSRHLSVSPHQLRLMTHRRPFNEEPGNAEVVRADLGDSETLAGVCDGVDCIVHFAGILFAPQPEKFLPTTNVRYVENLIAAALAAGVKKFILVSFPHVEGETTPERRATDRMDGTPDSVHARTRLEAERHVAARMPQPVILRVGMIYGRGVLMIDAARWLAKRRLLAVWRQPTWIHLLSLPDFLDATTAAIENPTARGIYNLGDDRPMTLQEFLDAASAHWGCRQPWRAPRWMFPCAGAACEVFAALFRTRAPLTRDFIRIGMASYAMDTSRMKTDLLSRLKYPVLHPQGVL
jgi:nucleoside-diphosphate-sugar epimerase